MDSVNLSSSLGNTSFTCPGESALFFCHARLTSDLLIWQVEDKKISFIVSGNSPVDNATICRGPDSNTLCGLRCFIISGILNNIQTSGDVLYCFSTLVITPGKLSDTTSELSPCMAEDSKMNLTVGCSTTDVNETKSYRVAGI